MATTRKSETPEGPGTKVPASVRGDSATKAPASDDPAAEAPSERTASSATAKARRFGRAAVTTPVTAPDEAVVNGGPAPPTFVIGGPATSSWREQSLTRIAELRTLTRWVRAQTDELGADELVASIEAHLNAAEAAAGGTDELSRRKRLQSWVTGAPVERTGSNLEAAEADLLRLAPLWYLRGQMPSFQVAVRRHLPADDPRRVRLEELARSTRTQELQLSDRDAIVTAVRGATSAGRREVTRVRSFRNVLFLAAAMLTLAAAVTAIIGASNPNAMPICFAPDDKIVCPTAETAMPASAQSATASPGQPSTASAEDIDDATLQATSPWDMFLVEFIGLIAASVAAAAALRNIKGTSTPYSLPVALAVLKLPTGALTALLGLLLMRGNFVPGLSALDSSAQILAWAIVFGYAQQLLTRLVDQQAHSVLDDVGGSQHRATAAS
jgi:hypothetical protein